MKDAVANRMAAAHRAFESSRLLLQQGDREGACNRAYYAMFHGAHAALQAFGIIAPGTVYKTHSGLVSAFSEELVQTGKLPNSLGGALGRVLNVRLLADYDSKAIGEDDAAKTIAAADIF